MFLLNVESIGKHTLSVRFAPSVNPVWISARLKEVKNRAVKSNAVKTGRNLFPECWSEF